MTNCLLDHDGEAQDDIVGVESRGLGQSTRRGPADGIVGDVGPIRTSIPPLQDNYPEIRRGFPVFPFLRIFESHVEAQLVAAVSWIGRLGMAGGDGRLEEAGDAGVYWHIPGMQHVLGVTTVWVALPASLHVAWCAQRSSAVDWTLVLLHYVVSCCSIGYWRCYDQKSLLGWLDSLGCGVVFASLAVRIRHHAPLETAALVGAIAVLYRSSIAFRRAAWAKAGVACHLAFRYLAFWLSMFVMAFLARGAGDSRLACLFGEASAARRVVQLTAVYILHTAGEFQACTPSRATWRGEAATLPWTTYVRGLARSLAIVAVAGCCIG